MQPKNWIKSGISLSYRPGTWEILDSAYREPHRAYHAWPHIDDLSDKLEKFRNLATLPKLITHAILWHDAVYQTQNPGGTPRADAENVKDSAALFLKQTLLSDIEKYAVHAMIMATVKHAKPDNTPEYYPGFTRDLNLFLDLDLSSLATSPKTFNNNTRKVRREYDWVDEKIFCSTRAEILAKFAAAKTIYKTPELEEKWGAKARANLLRSSRVLSRRAKKL